MRILLLVFFVGFLIAQQAPPDARAELDPKVIFLWRQDQAQGNCDWRDRNRFLAFVALHAVVEAIDAVVSWLEEFPGDDDGREGEVHGWLAAVEKVMQIVHGNGPEADGMSGAYTIVFEKRGVQAWGQWVQTHQKSVIPAS